MIKTYRLLYALIAFATLVAQLVVILQRAETGTGLMLSINYFSYFTILTNLLAAVVMLVSARRSGGWANAPKLRGAIVVYIALVALVYHTVLAQLLNLQGLEALLDFGFHSLLPAMFIADWVFFVRKNGLKTRHAVQWLAFPVLYTAYSLIRGEVTGWYPYPFFNPSEAGGYAMIAANIVFLSAAFWVVGLLVVWLRRKG